MISAALISVVAIGSLSFAISYTPFIGPTLLLLGALALLPLKLSRRSIKSCSADILFGVIDTGPLMIAALVGAHFVGALGAIVGGAAGDAITDAFAGVGEGKMAQYLRSKGIREARTPLSASMGKMSGCFFGAGTILLIAWTIARIPIAGI